MTSLAWIFALLLPVNFHADLDYLSNIQLLPIILLLQTPIAWYYGLYRSIWRFASLPDLWNIFRSALIGAVFISSFIWFSSQNIPHISLIAYPILLIFFLGAPRLSYRVLREYSPKFILGAHTQTGQRVLIIGAGRTGDMLVRDFHRDQRYIPVGFIDDNPQLHGARIQGLVVWSGMNKIKDTIAKVKPELLIIAMPSASDIQMQHIVEICEQTGLPVKTLPKISQLSQSPQNLSAALHSVAIDDLLGREKVQLDWQRIEAGITGKIVMVSGGGGSIGSELCHQIARLKPKALVIFERGEYNLYQIDLKLREASPETQIYTYLGDSTDPVSVEYALKTYKPDIIFHAAAYKHVPLLQSHTREAVRNNVLGTQLLAEMAVKYHCQTFVMISTDKAVNPTNIMGACKRIAEIFCQAMNQRSDTQFITVRFGNVLGSAGSVLPRFQQQIAQGGPVTVTHPEINRYFMTIPEACQLILQAGAIAHGGEIFVLDMGTPVKIKYLAEQLIRLSGKIPNKDIKIIYTGLRPGEKLHEELFHVEEEQMSQTRHNKIMQAIHRDIDWRVLDAQLKQLDKACQDYDEASLYQAIKVLVPELHKADQA